MKIRTFVKYHPLHISWILIITVDLILWIKRLFNLSVLLSFFNKEMSWKSEVPQIMNFAALMNFILKSNQTYNPQIHFQNTKKIQGEKLYRKKMSRKCFREFHDTLCKRQFHFLLLATFILHIIWILRSRVTLIVLEASYESENLQSLWHLNIKNVSRALETWSSCQHLSLYSFSKIFLAILLLQKLSVLFLPILLFFEDISVKFLIWPAWIHCKSLILL